MSAQLKLDDRPLWPHQQEALSKIRQAYSSSLVAGEPVRIQLQLPTGAGKTRLAAEIINGALAKGNRATFVVDAISLIDQTVESFEAEGIDDIGVIQADHERYKPSAPVQVCSIQTLSRRGFPETNLVIVDESHVIYQAQLDWMEQRPEVAFIGLSATPWAAEMGKHYNHLVQVITIDDLIKMGVLSDFVAFAPDAPDLSDVKVVAGEYQQDQLSSKMSEAVLVGGIVPNWQKLGTPDRTLVFCVDRAHARFVLESFLTAGIKAEYIDAFTSRMEREEISKRFHALETKVVVSIGTMIKGVDWDVRCLVDAQPTQSEIRHVQKIGRALRSAAGKDKAIIIDHAGNHAGRESSLGFVTDIHHDSMSVNKHSVSVNEKKKVKKEPKPCPKCSYLKPVGVHVCPSCGFAPVVREDVETRDGKLIELKRKQEEISAKAKANRDWSDNEKRYFFGGLKYYARENGYNPGWASHQYREKFGVWPNHFRDAEPQRPSKRTLDWIMSRKIAYIKSQKR